MPMGVTNEVRHLRNSTGIELREFSRARRAIIDFGKRESKGPSPFKEAQKREERYLYKLIHSIRKEKMGKQRIPVAGIAVSSIEVTARLAHHIGWESPLLLRHVTALLRQYTRETKKNPLAIRPTLVYNALKHILPRTQKNVVASMRDALHSARTQQRTISRDELAMMIGYPLTRKTRPIFTTALQLLQSAGEAYEWPSEIRGTKIVTRWTARGVAPIIDYPTIPVRILLALKNGPSLRASMGMPDMRTRKKYSLEEINGKVTRSTLKRYIPELVKYGFISRKNPDRKDEVIALTPRGSAFVQYFQREKKISEVNRRDLVALT